MLAELRGPPRSGSPTFPPHSQESDRTRCEVHTPACCVTWDKGPDLSEPHSAGVGSEGEVSGHCRGFMRTK